MEELSFNCKYGLGYWKITLTEDKIKIKPPIGKSLEINKNQVTKIDFKPSSYPMPDGSYSYNLYIYYSKDGKMTKKTLTLSFGDKEADNFIESLKKYFPDVNYLSPNQNEKKRILSLDYTGKYRLHCLYFLATTITFVILFGVISVLSFVFSPEDAHQEFYIIQTISIVFTLVFLVLLILLIAKKIYILKTTKDGINYQRVFKKVSLAWSGLSIGDIKFKEENIRGSINAFFVIPLIHPSLKKPLKIKLNIFTTAKLFAELYYREKVSLEKAKSVLAFL